MILANSHHFGRLAGRVTRPGRLFRQVFRSVFLERAPVVEQNTRECDFL